MSNSELYRRSIRNLSFWLCIAGVSACASSSTTTTSGTSAGTTSTGTSSQARPATPRRDRDVISKQELADPGLRPLSVYDVVRTLRPNFLSVRGRSSNTDPEAGQVHASIDYGGVVPLAELRNIHASAANEIRFLNAAAAMQRFGGQARQGPVIVVITQ